MGGKAQPFPCPAAAAWCLILARFPAQGWEVQTFVLQAEGGWPHRRWPLRSRAGVEQWARRAILYFEQGERMKHCPQCVSGYPDRHTSCPTHGLPLNEIRDLKPGMVVHHSYRIVPKLGQGGMGAGYLAQHTLMDEARALKFLSPELSRDQAFTGLFLREVRTLRQVRNRNAVDCGDLEAAEDGSLFFQ